MSTLPVPVGFRLTPAAHTGTAEDGTVVWGGTPLRILRLSSAGAEVATRLLAGDPIEDPRQGVLARRLLEAGLAHPTPPAGARAGSLEVVVPAYGRVDLLDRCLAALAGLPITVVDDASPDPHAILDVAARHGARVVPREDNGGPAAARNAGLHATTAPVVAFVDSDCVVTRDVVQALAAHLADPAVAAVAPRVVAHDGGRSPLDLGTAPANVAPGSAVAYVPTTALVARRSALAQAGRFDETLRYGEDVDLVWRLVEQGWRVRYDPAATAMHIEPTSRMERLVRGHRYGTSVGPLARRHPDALRGPALSGLWAPTRFATLTRGGMPRRKALRLVIETPIRTAIALADWTVPRDAERLAYDVGVWRGCVAAKALRPLLPRW